MNVKDEVETLDFEDNNPSLDETVEMLDFEADMKVSNEIDEMLDFTFEVEKDNEEKKAFDDLLKTDSKTDNKVEIDASKERLEDYTPSIKDFNIKSAKTRKIVKKSMLYVIILMLIGFEFFISKTGDFLNDLRVYASDNQPIKIVQNDKYGYIDYTGEKLVNPKYNYAEDYVKGYAIVKNANNLPLIIDKGGKEAVKTGTYFSLYRAGNDIIASKVTKDGLKYGILNENLKEKTPFTYDMISYKESVYTFVKDNAVGLINLDGKKIYEYRLTDKDDKLIEVEPCLVTDKDSQRYGVIKINSSSQIVNLKDGHEVTRPTLNELSPEENNVFYEVTSNGTKRYIYVEDNKLLIESESYNSLSIPSIKTGVLKAINAKYEYEYISTKSLEQIKKGLGSDDTFYGEDIFMYNDHNYKRNSNQIVLVKNGEAFKTVTGDFSVYKEYQNGVAIVKYNDGTFGYLNEEGNLINDVRYVEVGAFDSYGEAVAKTNEGYGVINTKGKVIIPFKYDEVKMASAGVKKLSLNNINNVFYAVKDDGRYMLYNAKGKKVNNVRYSDITFNEDHPLVKIATEEKDAILNTENKKEINLTSFNTEYKAYENYIIIKNEYYNYNGKLIYVDNGKDVGDN